MLIEVKDLVKSYEGHLAVDHLSFSVEKGKILGFLGPNGAGKSTTMNIMTGYISATDGEITIDGHDILDEPEEAKRAIGYLPEIPPLYIDMTVREYLKFVAELKGVKGKAQQEDLNRVMNLTKTTDVADRLIKHLSKGYRQRVGLAQAILGDPKVLILDEPMVGLDPQQILEMRDLIRNLSKDHAIILSSHILSEVSAVCDEVMIINRGKLVVSDTPDNLARHMENQEMIHLEVKGERARVQQVLSGVGGVTKVEIESEKSGFVKLVVYCGDNDLRESIFYALAEAHCPIMDMHISNRSLEDIFLELTGKDSGKKRKRLLEKAGAGDEIEEADSEIETAEIEVPETEITGTEASSAKNVTGESFSAESTDRESSGAEDAKAGNGKKEEEE